VDQSESAPGAGMSTSWVTVDWSNEFVTLTEVGPNLATQTNRNPILRVGWGWKKVGTENRPVFRISSGNKGSWWHPHLGLL
jgi:hypothetical protein